MENHYVTGFIKRTSAVAVWVVTCTDKPDHIEIKSQLERKFDSAEINFEDGIQFLEELKKKNDRATHKLAVYFEFGSEAMPGRNANCPLNIVCKISKHIAQIGKFTSRMSGFKVMNHC